MPNALITGGTRGIGLAISETLINAGYNLVIAARDQSRLDDVIKRLSTANSEVMIRGISCDVTQPSEVSVMVAEAVSILDSIDLLVNCAGRSGGGVTKSIKHDLWLSVIDTNLNSVFYVTKEILESDAMGLGGSIINIASTGGKQGVMYGAPYSAAKHGVVGFTKALGLELARDNAGITVNAICPGFVETEMAQTVRKNYAKIWEVSPEEAKSRIEARIPIGRYIEPEEVAGMVVYLASKQARGITAQAINICGGLGNY